MRKSVLSTLHVNIQAMQSATGIPAFKIERHLGISKKHIVHDKQCDTDMHYIDNAHWKKNGADNPRTIAGMHNEIVYLRKTLAKAPNEEKFDEAMFLLRTAHSNNELNWLIKKCLTLAAGNLQKMTQIYGMIPENFQYGERVVVKRIAKYFC